MNTCGEVEHIEVWREVVSDVPSGQMVQVGLMKELPSIPDGSGKDYFSVFLQIREDVERLILSRIRNT